MLFTIIATIINYAPGLIFAGLIKNTLLSLGFCFIFYFAFTFLRIMPIGFILIPLTWIASIIVSYFKYPFWVTIVLFILFILEILFYVIVLRNGKKDESN